MIKTKPPVIIKCSTLKEFQNFKKTKLFPRVASIGNFYDVEGFIQKHGNICFGVLENGYKGFCYEEWFRIGHHWDGVPIVGFHSINYSLFVEVRDD